MFLPPGSIQEEGLQIEYNDPDDRTLKEYVLMLLAFAYIPVQNVRSAFTKVRDACPAALLPVVRYFGQTYVTSVRRRLRLIVKV